MEKQWIWDANLTKSLKDFVMKLEAWSRDTFRNIFKRKSCNLLRMEGVTKAMERHPTEGLLKLDKKVKEERRELLLQEEMLWLQNQEMSGLRPGMEIRIFLYFNPCEKKE